MNKRFLVMLMTGLLALVMLTGCSAEKAPATGDEGKKVEEAKKAEITLKDIDFAAQGINLSGYNMDMLLSPDGKFAALSGYQYEQNELFTKLLIADLTAGTVKVVKDVSRVIGWFPNSEKVLYTFDGSMRVGDIKTGEFKEVAKETWNGAISPDGKQIAYSQYEKGLFIYNVDEAQTKQLTSKPYDRNPVWYPDGKNLFYFADLGKPLGDGAGNLEGMAKISVESGQIERISNEDGKFRRAEWILPNKSLHIIKGWDDAFYHGILYLENNKYMDLGENPYSSTYFYAVDNKNSQLIKASKGKVDVFNEQGAKVLSYSLKDQEMETFNFSVSPDGKRVAFVQGDYGRFMESKIKGNKVMVSDYDGQNLRELSDKYMYNDTITWDKTGKNIISLQMDMEKIIGIKIMPVI